MQSLKSAFKKIFILTSIVVLVGGFPLSVSAQADESSDSSSEQTEQKAPEYIYNPETETWDSEEWSWNPKTYETKPVVKPTPQAAVSEGSSTSNTGPDSNNSQSNNTNASSQTTINNGLGVNNTVNGTAGSGNSTVSQNTIAGSALSGDAQSIANIINMLQSATVLGEQGITTFQTDITGDVVGDLIINPDLIFNVGPGSQNSSKENTSIKSGVDVNTDAKIKNDVELAATSGNAKVDSNTEAGDATSGNAYVMANVVNVLNSVISANQSFLGLINIYGNLDGDILFPPETIDKLLKSNVPTSTVTINNVTGEVELNSANNLKTSNNISLDANSGTATVNGNNTAGSAASGEAKTNMTVLNLTGSEVIASNSILVFVNVLGTWVGMIMNAPEGSTAAALGGGVSESNINAEAEVNSTTNASIDNDIKLKATTGNAAVTNNNKAGNATTGNAYAAANVANINNSSLKLSNWFGMLFINVFGSWTGSFGVDTEAGNRAAANSAGGVGSQQQVFGFVPNEAKTNAPLKQYVMQTTTSESGQPEMQVVPVSGSTGAIPTSASTAALAAATNDNKQKTMLFTGMGVLVGATLLGADKASNVIQRRKNKREIFATPSAAIAKEV